MLVFDIVWCCCFISTIQFSCQFVKIGKWTQLNIMGNNCKWNLSRKFSENVISVWITNLHFDFATTPGPWVWWSLEHCLSLACLHSINITIHNCTLFNIHQLSQITYNCTFIDLSLSQTCKGLVILIEFHNFSKSNSIYVCS